MALARQWDELVDEVRKLDGFEDFLKPPRLETLLPAAAGGPIAIINVSQWRCDALLVTTKGVQLVELPQLTAESVATQAREYLEVLAAADDASRAFYRAPDRSDAERAVRDAFAVREQRLPPLLEWLWVEVAEPVLTALGYTEPPGPNQPWPRIWWCPTGLLTLLPLHAAGYHDQANGQTVLDRVVSSYTPTLRALLEARQSLVTTPGDNRLLMIALSDAPGEVPLPYVTRERDLLTSLFEGRCTLLEGKNATTSAAREALPKHRWVHFSCHGGQNLTDPSRGGLRLHDGVLQIADIGAGSYRGELAFLSACQTATGGVNLPDEAITLTAALHYTGYRHVIGTLWSVRDRTAAEVTRAVYTDLTSTGRFEPARSADALHRAVRYLRDTKRLPPSVWTPFTHTGP
jgi:hypothetical protein